MTDPRDIPLYISSGDDDMMVAFPPATKPSHCSMPFMVLRWYPCWRRKGQQNTLPNINRVHVILFLWQQQDRSADPVMMTYLRIGYQCITTHCSHDVSENFILWQCHGGRFSANGKPHYTTWFCGDLFIEGKKCKRIRSPALPLDWFVRFFSFILALELPKQTSLPKVIMTVWMTFEMADSELFFNGRTIKKDNVLDLVICSDIMSVWLMTGNMWSRGSQKLGESEIFINIFLVTIRT